MTISFASIVATIIGYINGLVWVLGSLAMVLFMYGVVQFIYHPSDKNRRKTMLWSLIALFVIFSLWGIIRLGCVTFDGVCGASSSSSVPCEFGTCNSGLLKNTGGLY